MTPFLRPSFDDTSRQLSRWLEFSICRDPQGALRAALQRSLEGRLRTWSTVLTKDVDLGLLRLGSHDAFPKGYPTVGLEDFDSIHEGMDIATCGFPLGNRLFNQLRTVTSSFSRGIVSSIIPSAGTAHEYVTGFQLDLRATHGNSGGPVFSTHTGQVFGVLQGGVNDQYGNFLFSRAESVYRAIENDSVDNILTMKAPPTS